MGKERAKRGAEEGAPEARSLERFVLLVVGEARCRKNRSSDVSCPGCCFAGDVGTIIKNDKGSDRPFKVRAKSGEEWWYDGGALESSEEDNGSGGALPAAEEYEEQVQALCDMGFEKQRALSVLRDVQGNVPAALEKLLA